MGVRLAREAQVEFFEAAVWYESQQEGLGFEFESEVAEVLADVSDAPARFPALKRGLRRALVGRFPYGVYFTEMSGEITVVGIIHLHRDPAVWESR